VQMPQDDAQPATLGARLDALGRQVAARHLVTYSWAPGVAPVLGHAAQLSELFQGRFERGETPQARPLATGSGADGDGRRGRVPAGQPLPAEASPGEPAGTADAAKPLPADVRARLRDTAGQGADVMRVHTGPAADRLARAQRADAVTEGADVYLRDGQFSPDVPAGFALLAHEAAHIAALLDPATFARRAAEGGPAAEEEMALGAERAARLAPAPPGRAHGPLVPARAHPLPLPAVVPHPRGASVTPAAQAQAHAEAPAHAGHTAPASARPMRAALDRDLAQAAPFDVEELRRGLINDLMRQLRTEFERGG
jgi:hypothetical protein